ncbi:unnamed protein product [Brachionus calyciflorus]|uniref:Uncharacterized protein n=1 Tax=Brachionus calyciflorus TaxID=104777 RepID=A0A813ZD78_9BILA|nr:unnamed protein product [Brachionus calyciflorus]
MAKKSSKLFEGFKESGIIEAVFLFKRQMSRTKNLFMHWALVLKGEKSYHLIEFGPNGINYNHFERLDECAKNMMGDHARVFAWRVKRLEEFSILGFSLSFSNQEEAYDFKPNKYSFNELQNFLERNFANEEYNFLLNNCQEFTRYLIFELRRYHHWNPYQRKKIESSLEASTNYHYNYDV